MSRAERIVESWSMGMQKGYTRLGVLMFLSKRPMAGYDIMKEIEVKTLGFWRLTPGGVYPVLKELEEKGYVKGRWKAKGKRKKKIYEITDEGRRFLEVALQRQQQIAEAIGSLFREFARDVLEVKLLPTQRTFDVFPFGKSLEEKPIDEQMRVLKRARARLREAIKLMDKRLEKLEELK